MYVYKGTECPLYTVGHYLPDGSFYAESDHVEACAAAERVHYLNGGIDSKLFGQVVQCVCDLLADTNHLLMDLGKRLDHDKN